MENISKEAAFNRCREGFYCRAESGSERRNPEEICGSVSRN
jgi:hypothetical protein